MVQFSETYLTPKINFNRDIVTKFHIKSSHTKFACSWTGKKMYLPLDLTTIGSRKYTNFETQGGYIINNFKNT